MTPTSRIVATMQHADDVGENGSVISKRQLQFRSSVP